MHSELFSHDIICSASSRIIDDMILQYTIVTDMLIT